MGGSLILQVTTGVTNIKTLLISAWLMALALTSAGAETQPAKSTAFPDFDDNGVVDFADFLLFVSHFGKAEERYDLNTDGQVDFSDFLIFVSHFGKKDPRAAFNIDVVFVDESDFTQAEKAIIQRAARRWEEVVVGDLPDVDYSNKPEEWYDEDLEAKIVVSGVIDDVRIFINDVDLGADGPAGRAGGLTYRYDIVEERGKWLPDIGAVVINKNTQSTLNRLRNDENYEYYEGHFLRLVIHEIGHVLGIGAWDWKQEEDADIYFPGPLAIKAFDQAGGTNYKGAKVPVENESWPSHWRESVFGDEVMTTSPSQNFNAPLSAITIQALADLGYKVDVSKADPYRLPPPSSKPAIGRAKFKCVPIIPKFKSR